ncbi:MAG TPA: hypothetical protein VF457_12165 [Burkholderiaceae bacterium]
MEIEYVTDPPLLPGLRCPRCRGKVRVIRTAPSGKSDVAVALARPIAWATVTLAGALGYLSQAVRWFLFAGFFVFPAAVVYLYCRDLMRGSFWCSPCKAEFPYARVSRR